MLLTDLSFLHTQSHYGEFQRGEHLSLQQIWSQAMATQVDTASCKLLPALLLMERAGLAVHDCVRQLGASARKIIVLVGGGNNGGDALVAARLLDAFTPEVMLLSAEPRSALTAEQLRIYTAVTGIAGDALLYSREKLARYAQQEVLIVDGIAGLGWRGEARAVVREVIAQVNSMSQAKVLSIDIPSGLETDGSAKIDTAIKADMTVTFGGRKAAHVLTPSRVWCGEVCVADIGFPGRCVQELSQQQGLYWVDPQPLRAIEPFAGLPRDAHKYQRGHVLVIGGSRGKYGAPLLSGLAALRGGAGLVSVALDTQVSYDNLPLELVYEHFFRDGVIDSTQLEKFVTTRRVRVIVIGPGTVNASIDDRLWQFLQKYTDAGGFVVIDAAAVEGVLERRAPRGVLLTPHPGEWERMTGAKLPHPHTLAHCAAIKRLATDRGMHLVYKDASPLLFDAQASAGIYACDFGDNSLAKAGSGDVLCGLIAAYLLAFGEVSAAFLTAYAHLTHHAAQLRAGKGQHSLLPSDFLCT